jgi:hypothetical protein
MYIYLGRGEFDQAHFAICLWGTLASVRDEFDLSHRPKCCEKLTDFVLCVCVCARVCVCACTYMYVLSYVYVCMYMHACTQTHTHTHTHTHTNRERERKREREKVSERAREPLSFSLSKWSEELK